MKKMMTIQIDLEGCQNASLSDKRECKLFLIDLVKSIGMKIIPERFIGSPNPVSFFFNDYVEESEFGVTGVVILYESHAAFHGYCNLNGYACVVVTSCKYFDPEKTSGWVKEYLMAEKCNYKVICSK